MPGSLASVLAWCDRRPVRAVLLVYGLSRVVAFAALAFAATRQSPTGVGHLDPGVLDMFGLWDGRWYAEIARDGYPLDPPTDPTTGRLTYNAWAFYPLLPALMAPFVALGAPAPLVGALLGLCCGAVAAVLAHRLLVTTVPPAERSGPTATTRQRWALLAVAFWCLLPATPVLIQPYTEALAAALFFGCLLAIQQSRHVVAGVLALLLGLTRAVAPALAVVALVVLVTRWRSGRREGRRGGDVDRGGAAFLIGSIAVSAVLWPAIVGIATGIPDAFLQTQAAWGQRPASGPFVPWLDWAWGGHGLLGIVVLVGVVASYLGLVLGRYGALLGPVLRAVAVAYPLYLLAVVRPITSMWRFLLLDLPISGLLAALTLRATAVSVRARRAVVLVVLGLLTIGVFAWTATIWTYEPFGSSPP